ncbi:MAG: aminotransferase class V-fold PLP-dependent enzyme [Phenylobacterium sp.]|uniref:pyridoxal phosphate-dependent decarboxylase family protein n=1 Tax=Phenylobacterium sp. TaxID=1871053 RepID=UPI002734B67E|nr:aminotransferase class V-fold PLP-dependent enzyme [Phenylobacterium sp.]MDP3749550.1 aminotransferase class V-fold PLP-dependent enzyme [Phenylobacterium sp.]
MSASKGLPKAGRPLEEIQAALSSALVDDVRAHWNRAFRPPADVQAVATEAYMMFMSDNGLMSLRAEWMGRFEDEVIEMCVGLFNGPADATGTFTSGGSESIYSALHAMREWAREKYPHITAPEIVAPYSLHPAFSKGAHYFDLKLVRTPLGPDRRGSVEAMTAAITPNTIGMAASAPCWPYGLYDPIDEIAAVAHERGLWMHTDACVGGYLAPFLERLGYAFPTWDFRNPGVMSISADLHKLGYCPKPASTVLWRSRDLLRYHNVHPSDWPGGQYTMRGFAGTRTAGPIFAAWAVMRYLGEDGYVELARKLMATREQMMDGVDAIPGLKAWRNDLLPIAIESTEFDLATIKAAMTKLGWMLVGSAEPPLINVPIDAATEPHHLEAFLGDLRKVVDLARASGLSDREALNY